MHYLFQSWKPQSWEWWKTYMYHCFINYMYGCRPYMFHCFISKSQRWLRVRTLGLLNITDTAKYVFFSWMIKRHGWITNKQTLKLWREMNTIELFWPYLWKVVYLFWISYTNPCIHHKKIVHLIWFVISLLLNTTWIWPKDGRIDIKDLFDHVVCYKKQLSSRLQCVVAFGIFC